MRQTNIALAILTIDVLRIDEDQMATNGTPFKGEVPMTHLVFDLNFGKREGETGTVDLGAVGGGRGYRRWTGAEGFGCERDCVKTRLFDQNRTFKFKINQ